MGRWAERARPHLLPLAAVIALAACLAFYRIGTRDIWLDEATTFHRASLPIDDLIKNSIRKRHVPTYFLFMHPWLSLGDSELMLRLPSAVFGILTVGLMYAAGIMIGGLRMGMTAAALLAVSPFHVRYCQEARMYSMLTFAACAALIGALWLASECARPPPADPSTRRARTIAWIAIGAGTLATLYLHNTGLFFAATLGTAAVATLVVAPGHRGRLARGCAIVLVVVALAYMPWIPKLLLQTEDLSGRAWGRVTTSYVSKVLGQLYLMEPRAGLLSLAMALAGIAGAWSLRDRRAMLVTLLTVFLVGPAIFIGVSIAYRPMFGPRLLLWTALPLTLLCAAGLSSLRLRAASTGATAALLLWIGVANADRYHPDAEIPWRSLATQLRDAQHSDNSAVIIFGLPLRPLRYYFERKSDAIGPVRYVQGSRKPRRISRFMRKRVGKHKTVWLVTREDRDGFHTRPAVDWLDARGERIHEERHGRARIFAYRLK